jgi:hypothetical protein
LARHLFASITGQETYWAIRRRRRGIRSPALRRLTFIWLKGISISIGLGWQRSGCTARFDGLADTGDLVRWKIV